MRGLSPELRLHTTELERTREDRKARTDSRIRDWPGLGTERSRQAGGKGQGLWRLPRLWNG